MELLHRNWGEIIGKILLVSFDGNEEDLIGSVVSVLDSGRKKFTFHEIQLKSQIQYRNIIIDLKHREIIRDNKKLT